MLDLGARQVETWERRWAVTGTNRRSSAFYTPSSSPPWPEGEIEGVI